MQRVVAFDLDGTLVDSKYHLLPAYRQARQELGLDPLPDEVLLQCIGGTRNDNRDLVLPGRPLEDFVKYDHVVARHAMDYARQCGRAYPGVVESLDRLREKGYKTVLCSNGSARTYAEPLLRILNVLPHLDHLQQIEPGQNKAQLLASIIRDFDCEGSIVMVGDRHFDAEAARENGVPFIGCRYGLFPGEIDDAHPDISLESLVLLPEAVDQLIG